MREMNISHCSHFYTKLMLQESTYMVYFSHTGICVYTVHIMYSVMFLMRDENEERKKQARSSKQTRQSNTAHPRQSCTCIYSTCRSVNPL